MPSKEMSLNNTLTGTLLVSAPGKNVELEECVIYLFEHASFLGGQGIVINRQSKLTVNDLLEKMDYSVDGISLKSPLYHGGSEDESGILMLHTAEWYSSNTRPVTEEVSVTSDTFMIEKLMLGNEPQDWIMCAGKCSWEPGALEKEIKAGKWLVVPAPLELIFNSSSDEQHWHRALEYCTKYTVDSWL